MRKFKATVYVRLRESVSDAAGNAVKANVNKVARVKRRQENN